LFIENFKAKFVHDLLEEIIVNLGLRILNMYMWLEPIGFVIFLILILQKSLRLWA